MAINTAAAVMRIESPLSYSRPVIPGLVNPALPLRPKRNPRHLHERGASSFGVVYVNDIARRAMMEMRQPEFPVGSVIVREKMLSRDEAQEPQMLAVMVKRERGFNKRANDWEFLLLDGRASAVTLRQKTGDCRSCHLSEKKNDFVFRTYLPESVRGKLQ
ncbi:MAG: cytochrome P460 family protein [Acidobacteria bacterium]|nr:cytochrome P460 family protein [Acidobacteriota bacterium]